MVGRITQQQIRVFGMFVIALVLSGIATAYAHAGMAVPAVASAAIALGLVGDMVREGLDIELR